MADFNKPTVDSEYTQFPTEIRAAISAALSFLDGEHTNVPLKAKRWNPSTKIFEEYNGAQWVPMATEYKLPVDYNSLKNKPTPNSAVDDESDTKFASSAAVKAAYDKAAEAKTTADDALIKSNDGINRANNAQRTANDGVSKANSAQISANQAKSAADAAQSSANAANNNANGRILKTDISHAINGSDKAKVASEFALGELNKKFTLSQNLSETGWCKLPNGLIFQWGKFNKGYGSVRDEQRLVTFPITFPNKVLFVGLTEFTNAWSYSTTVENRQRMTNSGFYVISQRNDSMYFALGF